MKLLENELVRKYFGVCKTNGRIWASDCIFEANYDKAQTALAVIEAMEAPIKKNEKVLVFSEGKWVETQSLCDYPRPGFHFGVIRCPDAFQVDPVEKQIELVKKYVREHNDQSCVDQCMDVHLRALVSLARKQ